VIPGPGLFARIESLAERYPCVSCACGCATARQCWTSCCCHTPEERLAWAIGNGVNPPEYVTFSTQTWIAAANLAKAGSATCAGCVSGIKDRLARGERLDRGAATTDKFGRVVPAGADASAPSAGRAKTYAGPSIGAFKCRGLHTLMLVAAPPSLHAHDAPLNHEPCSGPRRAFIAAAAESRSLATPAPPPKARA
jgi:hypothetical protein